MNPVSFNITRSLKVCPDGLRYGGAGGRRRGTGQDEKTCFQGVIRLVCRHLVSTYYVLGTGGTACRALTRSDEWTQGQAPTARPLCVEETKAGGRGGELRGNAIPFECLQSAPRRGGINSSVHFQRSSGRGNLPHLTLFWVAGVCGDGDT